MILPCIAYAYADDDDAFCDWKELPLVLISVSWPDCKGFRVFARGLRLFSSTGPNSAGAILTGTRYHAEVLLFKFTQVSTQSAHPSLRLPLLVLNPHHPSAAISLPLFSLFNLIPSTILHRRSQWEGERSKFSPSRCVPRSTGATPPPLL